ncbi:hypothetical protein NDU88_004659 [Pleurodeles waltl]|uniref:Uncharacterized protein n=1 Tax=Pleurodeles waltl TaxID=8319 RepID=A0AAV7PFU8_PLEWA|nr:hypothetical protein NDU88_004659 [Pleurodeles waltl]
MGTDGARLIPSLRRGQYKSEVKACHLRAIRCPGEGGGLGDGPGSGQAPAITAKCPDPTVGHGRGCGPSPCLEPGPCVRQWADPGRGKTAKNCRETPRGSPWGSDAGARKLPPGEETKGAGQRPVLRGAEEPSGDREAPGGLNPTVLQSATETGSREVRRVVRGRSRAL